MAKLYTHQVSFEKFDKFLKMWVECSFRTFEESLPIYQKMFGTKQYRNVKFNTL